MSVCSKSVPLGEQELLGMILFVNNRRVWTGLEWVCVIMCYG